MAKRPVTALTVILEVGVALVVAALAGGAAWLVWGVSGIAFGAASIAIGTAGQTLFTQKRWAAGIMLIAIAALASFAAFILLLPKPTAPPPPIARSPMLLPGVRPWPNGVVPVCWLNRPERGTASSDDLRMILAVKGAEEAWSAAGAVSFHDVGACPSEFHGVRLLIGRTIDDPDSPALGSALADQDRPVTVPFVFPSRGGCSSGGRFGSADVCALGEALHELGHAIGLPDIHYSQSAPDTCKATLRQDRPALAIPYDPASVMNACNPDHLLGRLSPGDIAAIQQIYGR